MHLIDETKNILRRFRYIYFKSKFKTPIKSNDINYESCVTLRNKGIFIKNAINKLIISNNLQNYISLEGHETWLFLTIKDNIKVKPELIKAYIRQELIKKRILFLGSFNITYSHNYNDLKKTITEIEKIFYFLNKNLHEIRKFVHIKLQKNIFEVRKSDKK